MPGGVREHGAFALVLLIAAGLRLAACFVWDDDLRRDPDAYAALASRLVETGGFVRADGSPTAFRPPLYPYVLAGIHWAGPAAIAFLQIVLGTATAGLTALLGRRLGLERWSLLAALLVAVDPLLLRYTPQVMTETLCTFLAVLVLWLAAGRRRPFLLGAAFGLAVLSRPTFWAFGMLAAVWWVFEVFRHRFPSPWGEGSGVRGGLAGASSRLPSEASSSDSAVVPARPTAPLTPGPSPQGEGGRGRDRRSSLRSAMFVVLGVAIVVLPWVLRNGVVFGRPVLTTTHGGYTLLLANNPVFWKEVLFGPAGATWSGDSLDRWQRSLDVELVDAGIPPDDELARDRWMKQQALEHIRQRPDLFVRSGLYRLRRLWDVVPPGAAAMPGGVRWSIGAFYAAIFVLALAGLYRLIATNGWNVLTAGSPLLWGEGGRHTPASWWPGLLLIVAFTAVHAVYWTDTRMRAPLVPAVALLAARSLTGVSWGAVRRQKRPET